MNTKTEKFSKGSYTAPPVDGYVVYGIDGPSRKWPGMTHCNIVEVYDEALRDRILELLNLAPATENEALRADNSDLIEKWDLAVRATQDVITENQALRVRLEDAESVMAQIDRRSTPHVDDTDEDRKRDLRHVNSAAKAFLASKEGEALQAETQALRVRLEDAERLFRRIVDIFGYSVGFANLHEIKAFLASKESK